MKIKDILKNNINNEQKLALEQVLNLSKTELIVNKDRDLTKKEYRKYKKINEKLDKDLPIQYILKKAYFYNSEFYVNKHVLIPRPETEVLVQETHKLIEKNFKNKKTSILDIGTGSGIIAITLKELNNNYNITATDISKKALKMAKNNAKRHNVSIKFIKTDLYKGICDKYDVIISNPPYIDKNTANIEQKVIENEPHLALFADDEGLYYYKQILKDIKSIVKDKHIIAFEIGENQGEKIKKIAKQYLPNDEIIIKTDFNNYDRYIFIKGSKENE